MPGFGTIYGWASRAARQRVKATLAIDEEREDVSVPFAERIGLRDNGWRLLPDVAREEAAAANLLETELQALVGPEEPSRDRIRTGRSSSGCPPHALLAPSRTRKGLRWRAQTKTTM